MAEEMMCSNINNDNIIQYEERPERYPKTLLQQIRNPIHNAALIGDLDTVKYLIQHGFNVNGCSRDGKTTLHYAVISGNSNLVEYLTEEIHMSPEDVDNDGHTPSFYKNMYNKYE